MKKVVLPTAALCGFGMLAATAAQADNVVAKWIQLGPGSSVTALANGGYGDTPLSGTPTILARAVISGGSCPTLTLDHNSATTVAMKQRFNATQTGTIDNKTGAGNTGTPSTASLVSLPVEKSAAAGYPSYFINPNPAYATFPNGNPVATTSWTECETVIPAGHTVATITGSTSSSDLKLPVANPKRILVIADTGCRMKSSSQQNCNNPQQFPLAFLASYEAQFNPDLIIHVGDYFYRDTNCLVSGSEYVTGCNTPTSVNYETWGDTLDSWNGDLFFPAAPLLAAAPWVMTRGNHESCGRGARGWFALLDPHPYSLDQVACRLNVGLATDSGPAPVYTGDFTPTYVVPAGIVNLLVHDSSFANDSAVDANMAANYKNDLALALNAVPPSSSNVYVTHKPTFGLEQGSVLHNGSSTDEILSNSSGDGDDTQQYEFTTLFGGSVPKSIALFLSGHIHQFQYLNFANYSVFAPQLVVGVGGDNLDPNVNPDNNALPTYEVRPNSTIQLNDTTTASNYETAVVTNAYAQAEFGFAVLDQTPTGYTASVYNVGATKAGRCTITLSPRGITCWK